jgi:hypothetical protein
LDFPRHWRTVYFDEVMKMKLAAMLVGTLALNTAFALERPWEKIGVPEAVKTSPVESAQQGTTLAGMPLDNALVRRRKISCRASGRCR